jgi:ribosome maturation factor RimP
MSTPERVRALVEPLVADLQLDLYDLEYSGGVVRVTVDQVGGVGMDAITSLTRSLSRAFDDQNPIEGHFTLEVSSPGLERTLRTPAHFAGAIGTRINVKAVAHLDGARRFTGTLVRAGDTDVEVALDEPAGEPRVIAYDQIERARTVFEWGPAPKPGKGPKSPKAPKATVPEKKVDAP